MRLLGDGLPARIVRIGAALTLASALGACGMVGGGQRMPLATAPVNGPQADYPVVIGEPYSVAGTSYTPEDVLNYDEVGFVTAAEGAGVSAAHHTLPLPSYVEVTSLETGRTILVRVERRGPMDGSELLALSPDALTQLQAAPGAPVRVRRVNPPEEHRALLRAGQTAPERMDTPMPLVEVLKRRLPAQGSAPPRSAEAAGLPAPEHPAQVAAAPVRQPAVTVTPPPAARSSGNTPPPLPPLPTRGTFAPLPEQAAARVPSPASPVSTAPSAEDGYVVQAAAFSTADRARRAANVLGGEVSQSGRLYRVRTGPFATRGEAEASLAKVRAAGYTDARIFTSG
ncbi:MAG TPA: SPOR domain-containing protein [Croceibacterium sp.]|nr:SPOR domain-containing protein [Croceibacterium sp.]